MHFSNLALFALCNAFSYGSPVAGQDGVALSLSSFPVIVPTTTVHIKTVKGSFSATNLVSGQTVWTPSESTAAANQGISQALASSSPGVAPGPSSQISHSNVPSNGTMSSAASGASSGSSSATGAQATGGAHHTGGAGGASSSSASQPAQATGNGAGSTYGPVPMGAALLLMLLGL